MKRLFFAIFFGMMLGLGSGAIAVNDTHKDFLLRGDHSSQITDYLLQQYMDLLRTPQEAQLYNLIMGHPEYRKIAEKARRDLASEMQEAKKSNAANMALASQDQYREIFEQAHKVLKKAGVPITGRKNLNVFVSGDPTVNAYTYSVDPRKQIDFVILQGLADALPSGAREAVIAHELGHNLAEHILINVVVQTIFDASFEIIIPKDEETVDRQGANKDEVSKTKNKWRESLLAARETMHIGMARNYSECLSAANPSSEFVTSLVSYAKRLGAELAATKPTVVKELALNIAKILTPKEVSSTAKTFTGIVQGLRLGVNSMEQSMRATEADDIETSKALKMAFQEALESLSRSNEQTSDHVAITLTSPQKTSEAFLKLLAPGATLEGIRQQSELFDVGDTQHIRGTSHPGLLSRILYPEIFARRLEYQIASNSFNLALYIYFSLSRDLKATGPNTDLQPILKPYQHMVRDTYREQFNTAAQKLKTAILNDVMTEVKSIGTKEPKKLAQLIEFLTISKSPISDTEFAKDLINMRSELEQEMGRPGRLLADIVAELNSLKTQTLAANNEALKEYLTLAVDQIKSHYQEDASAKNNSAQLSALWQKFSASQGNEAKTAQGSKLLCLNIQ
jgi:Peptidase family M48